MERGGGEGEKVRNSRGNPRSEEEVLHGAACERPTLEEKKGVRRKEWQRESTVSC